MIQADVIDRAKETAHEGVAFAEKGAKSVTSSVTSSARTALRTFGDVVAMLRSLGVNDVLGTVGLAKKQSTARWFGTFGTGMSVGLGLGVGVGMLFAPRAGIDTRAAIAKAARDIFGVEQTAKTDISVTDETSRVDVPKDRNGTHEPLHA